MCVLAASCAPNIPARANRTSDRMAESRCAAIVSSAGMSRTFRASNLRNAVVATSCRLIRQTDRSLPRSKDAKFLELGVRSQPLMVHSFLWHGGEALWACFGKVESSLRGVAPPCGLGSPKNRRQRGARGLGEHRRKLNEAIVSRTGGRRRGGLLFMHLYSARGTEPDFSGLGFERNVCRPCGNSD